MFSSNQVVLIGRLTEDAGFYLTRSGRPKLTFRMAVPRPGGWKGPKADYVTVVCLGRRFQPLLDQLVKGVPVTVIGRLQSRDIPDGRTAVEVRAEAVLVNVELATRGEG